MPPNRAGGVRGLLAEFGCNWPPALLASAAVSPNQPLALSSCRGNDADFAFVDFTLSSGADLDHCQRSIALAIDQKSWGRAFEGVEGLLWSPFRPDLARADIVGFLLISHAPVLN